MRRFRWKRERDDRETDAQAGVSLIRRASSRLGSTTRSLVKPSAFAPHVIDEGSILRLSAKERNFS